jgi:putative protease
MDRGDILEGELRELGKVSHFFSKINVAIVEVTDTISIGDKILIKGPMTDIAQTVTSMEIEHQKIQKAEAGQSIGMKVDGNVRTKDTVYKVS